MHFIASVAQLPRKRNDLANDQFRDAAGIGEGGVENANSMRGGILQVNLIRANAEAANYDQVLCGLENSRRELCLAADANDVDVPRKPTVRRKSAGKRRREKKEGLLSYRIFSISWSSGKEDFRASTWYP